MFIVASILHCCLILYCVHQTVQTEENYYQNDEHVFSVSGLSRYRRSDPSVSGVDPTLQGISSACLGYELANNLLGHYKIHLDKQSWYDAKQVCIQENAHLLIINSQQEANSVRKLLTNGGYHQYYWAGFHDIYEEGNYVTVFNESLNSTGFAIWGIEEPDGRPGENCGVFGSFVDYKPNNYALGDWLCNIPLPYICEQESLIQSSPKEGPSFEGYHLIPYVGYYKKHKTYKKWQDAVDICKQEGGHLIIIESINEQEALWKFLKETESYMFCFWTGVHDQYEEGNYVTIFNKTNEFRNYLAGNAPGGADKNCMEFCYAQYTQGLTDNNCKEINYFICEHEI